jgi:hypothetical protein
VAILGTEFIGIQWMVTILRDGSIEFLMIDCMFLRAIIYAIEGALISQITSNE